MWEIIYLLRIEECMLNSYEVGRSYSEIEAPTTVKVCRSSVRMVNFLSLFCPELQKLLKPI